METYKDYYKNGQFVERKYVSKSHYRKIDKTVLRAPGAEGTPSAGENPAAPGTTQPTTSNPVPYEPSMPETQEPVVHEPESEPSAPAEIPVDVSPTPSVEEPVEMPVAPEGMDER